MNETKVNIATRQLVMAAALIAEAKKVLSEEGIELIDPNNSFFYKEPAFQIICKGPYAKAGVSEIAEAIEDEVMREQHNSLSYAAVKSNGIVIFELEEENKNENG